MRWRAGSVTLACMVRWNDTTHVVGNGVATVVWLAAAYSIGRVPAAHFKQGWRSKGLWLFFSLGPCLYVGGFLLPFGWIVALGALRFDRKPIPRNG
jgi:hypothetical protein